MIKKLSEYKNEEALDIIADILDPVVDIFSDKDTIYMLQINRMSAIKHVIKNHKKSVLTILAVLEGVPVDEYECNVLSLPVTLMQLLNDEDLLDFFNSQGLEIGNESSGSATENIEDAEEA